MNLDSATYEQNTEPMCSHINVGTCTDLTIYELAETIKDVVGYKGKITFDPSKPDGSPRATIRFARVKGNFAFVTYNIFDRFC